tara:strand:+ start:407 stop:622 length:216 start_codon:yes stop_codon:yes gene_type:complete
MADDPKPVGYVEFMEYRFSQLEPDDIFYYNQTEDNLKNPPHRKVNDNECLLISNQTIYEADPNDFVYQKMY